MYKNKKNIKHAKVTEIFWTPFNNGCYMVRFESKKKHGWPGLPGPDMKTNDCAYLYIKKPIGTPHSELLKIAYEMLNN